MKNLGSAVMDPTPPDLKEVMVIDILTTTRSQGLVPRSTLNMMPETTPITPGRSEKSDVLIVEVVLSGKAPV